MEFLSVFQMETDVGLPAGSVGSESTNSIDDVNQV